MPELLNHHRDVVPPGAVSIQRPGPFGNPVRVEFTCPVCGSNHNRRRDGTAALACYGDHLLHQLRTDGDFTRAVMALESVPALVCSCAPAPCHGEALVVYLEELSTKLGMLGLGPDDKPTRAQLVAAHRRGLQWVERWRDAQRPAQARLLSEQQLRQVFFQKK